MGTRTRQPPAVTVTCARFCRYHLGPRCFASFTGTDGRAWRVFVAAVELYPSARLQALDAMAAAAEAAQPKTYAVFVQSIASILDWSTAPAIWQQIAKRLELPPELHALAPVNRERRRAWSAGVP